MDINIRGEKKKRRWRDKTIKVWKLNDCATRREFQRSYEVRRTPGDGDWTQFRDNILDAAREVCGETSGGGGVKDRETWWWNPEVQNAVKEKRIAYKRWQGSLRQEDKRMYSERKREAKIKVSEAKAAAWQQWSQDLTTSEGRLKIFKIARQMKKERKDVIGVRFIKGEDGAIKTEKQDILRRWQ